jgi:hypothetical protein
VTEDARLRSAIRDLERVIERDGPDRSTLASLAELHAQRAVVLSGMGGYSEALVEIAMAIDHDGGTPRFHRIRADLTAKMEAVRLQAAAVRHVDPRINPEDLVLLAEARRGFVPMQLYQSSRRAIQTRALARQYAS